MHFQKAALKIIRYNFFNVHFQIPGSLAEEDEEEEEGEEEEEEAEEEEEDEEERQKDKAAFPDCFN